jgi:hypothetical protein
MSTLQDLATQASQYQQMYQQGQLSVEDFKELVNDLNIAGNINANAEEFQQNQQYREILLGVIQLAQLAA